MSTREVHRLTCPGCGETWEEALFRGLRIGRLPEVREAILQRRFEIFRCPACFAAVQAHGTPLVFTDFQHFQYIGVEGRGLGDVEAALLRHRVAFDRSFVFGPEAAESLGRQLVPRLVFGLGCLREKLIIADGGLDDRVVEAVKGDLQRSRGWSHREQQLRVEEVLDGGHLLLARMPALPRSTSGDVYVGAPTPVLGWEMVTAQQVARRAARREEIGDDYPWLGTEWLVDLHITAL